MQEKSSTSNLSTQSIPIFLIQFVAIITLSVIAIVPASTVVRSAAGSQHGTSAHRFNITGIPP